MLQAYTRACLGGGRSWAKASLVVGQSGPKSSQNVTLPTVTIADMFLRNELKTVQILGIPLAIHMGILKKSKEGSLRPLNPFADIFRIFLGEAFLTPAEGQRSQQWAAGLCNVKSSVLIPSQIPAPKRAFVHPCLTTRAPIFYRRKNHPKKPPKVKSSSEQVFPKWIPGVSRPQGVRKSQQSQKRTHNWLLETTELFLIRGQKEGLAGEGLRLTGPNVQQKKTSIVSLFS